MEEKIGVVHNPDVIKGFEEHASMVADGSKLEADVAVLATGYVGMLTSAQEILGDEVAGRCKDVWTLGDEGEIRTVNWILSSVLLLLVDAERYGVNHCLLIEGVSEVGAEWSLSLLVHGWKSCSVSDLLPHVGFANQGC